MQKHKFHQKRTTDHVQGIQTGKHVLYDHAAAFLTLFAVFLSLTPVALLLGSYFCCGMVLLSLILVLYNSQYMSIL